MHIEGLNRICGIRAQKSGKKPRQTTHHIGTILNLFNIDTTQDTAMHSTSLCSACYSKVKYYEPKPVAEWASRVAEQLKPTEFWCQYRDNIPATQCTLCDHYFSLGKAGRKRKLAKVSRSEATEEEDSITITESTTLESPDYDPEAPRPSSSQDTAQPLITSTPKRCRRSLILETNRGSLTKVTPPIESTCRPSTSMTDSTTLPMKKFKTSLTQTDVNISPNKIESHIMKSVTNKQLNPPLTAEEEKIATHLIRRMLAQSQEKYVVKLKTGGQPIVLQRLSQPRKSSDIASSPKKRRRTKNVSTTRSLVSGQKPEAVEVQEERDIKKDIVRKG